MVHTDTGWAKSLPGLWEAGWSWALGHSASILSCPACSAPEPWLQQVPKRQIKQKRLTNDYDMIMVKTYS